MPACHHATMPACHHPRIENVNYIPRTTQLRQKRQTWKSDHDEEATGGDDARRSGLVLG
jgi:hypothetical protein